MSAEPLAAFHGANGVEVAIHDRSRPYAYSNLFQVRLEVVARVPGAQQPYRRLLERVGVYAEALAEVRRELLAAFEGQALPYLLRADFPARYRERATRSQVPPAAGRP